MDAEKILRVDETSEADAAEQQAVVFDEETGLDTSHLAHVGDYEANEADVIDQAIVVPIADDERYLP